MPYRTRSPHSPTVGIVRLLVVCRVCACVVGLVATAQAYVQSFSDIRYWVGSGTHKAAMVVDWAATPDLPTLVWGFRWNGAATGETMFRAIAEADPRLYARLGETDEFGTPLYGVGYDRDRDGFGLSDGTPFSTGGIAVTSPSDDATALDPQDSYNEGWFSAGFWGYYLGNGNPYGGGSWESAETGFSGRTLSDGDWDGFRYAPGFMFESPSPGIPARPSRITHPPMPSSPGLTPVPIPEPGGIVFLLLGAFCTCLMRSVFLQRGCSSRRPARR